VKEGEERREEEEEREEEEKNQGLVARMETQTEEGRE
jgi:hypothetical protein